MISENSVMKLAILFIVTFPNICGIVETLRNGNTEALLWVIVALSYSVAYCFVLFKL